MRTTRLLVLVPVGVALAVAGPLVPTAAAPAGELARAVAVTEVTTPTTARRFQEYVALGDSWTADVVLVNGDGLPDDTYAPIDCGQSHRNYPKLVRAALGTKRFRDASCGSATTDDFAHAQRGLPAGGTNRAQFARLTKRTDLVTVGIGGNDAGMASAGVDCFNLLPVANPLPTDQIPVPDLPIPGLGSDPPLGGCKEKYTAGGVDQLSKRIREARPKLVRAFRAIHRRSPDARILVVDYMAVVPDHGCYPTLPANDEDMAYISAKFDELNAMLARAARRGGAEIVRTFSHTVGHGLCKGPTVRYAETYGPSVNDPSVGVPAHPNLAGARAQAATVLDYLAKHP